MSERYLDQVTRQQL